MTRKASARLLAASSAIALCAGVLASGAAQAADPAPASGDVVVTAQFREQNLQQTPIAITAINAATLEQRSQTNLIQVAQQAPNVTLQPGSGSFGPTMQTFIRGVGQADFNFAFEPGVGVYIDDVYFASTLGSLFDLLDLDRVEILRGPQGTLAGMNSIGGSIKLFSKKPNGQGGGFVQGTYGSYNRTEFRGSADFTVVPDKLFMRISGAAKHENGYVTRYDFACTHPQLASQFNIPSFQNGSTCKLGTEGGKEYAAVRTALRWAPSEKLEVNLIGDFTHDRSEAIPQTLTYIGQIVYPTPGAPYTLVSGLAANQSGSALVYPRWTTAPTNGLMIWDKATGKVPFMPSSPYGPSLNPIFPLNQAADTFTHDPYVNYSTYIDVKPSDGSQPWAASPEAWVSGWGVSGQINYNFSDSLNVTSITAYRRYSARWAQDYEGTELSSEQLTYDIWHWQLSQELRLQGRLFNDRVNWVLGGFYFDENSHYGGRNELGSFEFIEDDLTPATNKAVFGNIDWQVTDKLELNGGIRYSTESKTFIFGRGGFFGNTYPQKCAITGVVHVPAVAPQVCAVDGAKGSFNGDNVDYRAVVQYQWTPSFMTYASVATGFKGGGVNPRPFYADNVTPFSPEHLISYEVGIKSSWFGRRLRANLSIFDSEYTDLSVGVVSGLNPQTGTNTGCLPNPGSNEVNCSFTVNAGEARFRGVELETQLHPFGGLSIDGSVSYLKFTWKNLTAAGLASNFHYGDQAPFAPEWKYSLGVQYDLPIGEIGSVIPRVDMSHQDHFFTNYQNNPFTRIAGYTLWNGRVTFRPADSMWEGSVEISNMFNKLYYLNAFSNGSNGTVSGEPAAPRRWAVTVKRRF
jgi:iron complex outermembrane receptor protein